MKLPEIMNQLSILCSKMHTERLKTLKENEEHVAKGAWSSSEESDDDDDEGSPDKDGDMPSF